ncbi:MAG: iron ABC transporter substrate-binding protein [Planctomycetia bacterium]|nr:iron ABC transporter substrate-binding protein [Planctomycetia bacterium]
MVLFWLCFFFFLETGCYRLSEQEINQGKPIRTFDEWQSLGKTEPVQSIVCSGSGALRLISYLDASEKVLAVEQIEKQSSGFATYRLRHPEFAELPVFGEGHGRDNIEFLLNMNPKPEAIIRVDNPGTGVDPQLLQARTGIPVILLPYGDLGNERLQLNQTLRLLGQILGKKEKAESLIAFIDAQINELIERTRNIPKEKRPTVYLGGLSYRGAHGINSTTTIYPPFDWLHLNHPASSLVSETLRANHIMVSKEQILAWNPDFLFVDLGTLALADSSGFTELYNQSIYRSLKALQNQQLYPLLPNNSYNTNFDAMLANAWFIGKTVYPEQFKDVDLAKKWDEISRFMLNDSFMNVFPEKFLTILNKPVCETLPLDGTND